ncbi:MAG: STAS domain-containing protein [Nitrospiraceae bacterium]|nr:STAS domain-containing protein [Nitrospiraceae bacterium]
MELREDTAGTVHRLHIAGELTIYSALELKPRLLGALAQKSALEIHAGNVTEVDTAGIQLLLLAKREAAGAGKQLSLMTPSQSLREALGQCFLNEQLDHL